MKPPVLIKILDASANDRLKAVTQLSNTISQGHYENEQVQSILNYLMLMLIEEKDENVYESVMRLLSHVSESGFHRKKIEGFVASHIKSMRPGAADYARKILTGYHVEERSDWLSYFNGLEQTAAPAPNSNTTETLL